MLLPAGDLLLRREGTMQVQMRSPPMQTEPLNISLKILVSSCKKFHLHSIQWENRCGLGVNRYHSAEILKLV
uniref:Uncharacterized protein n=1 Tax=Oryza brachyantha TaxID=4533 RepID=J3MZ18_ORYBR